MKLSSVLFFTVFTCGFAAAGGDFPFIPYTDEKPFVRFDNETEEDIPSENAFGRESFVFYYSEPDGGYSDIYAPGAFGEKAKTAEYTVFYPGGNGDGREYGRIKNAPMFFAETAALHYSVSANPGISGAVAGGVAAGFSVGWDRFKRTGVIDLGAGAGAASLMAGSSYVGVRAGSYVSDLLVKPVLSGGVVSGAISGAAGGSAAGALFAVGAFAAGFADRHEMRMIAVKSAAGSSAAAGITAVLGGGAGIGAVSAGGFILPYAAAAGAVYVVEKVFKAFDKQEEKERIERLLLEIAR